MKLSFPLQINHLCPILSGVFHFRSSKTRTMDFQIWSESALQKVRHKYPWDAFGIGSVRSRILVLQIWPVPLSAHNHGLSRAPAKWRKAQGIQPQTSFPCYLQVLLKRIRVWSQCHNPNTNDSCAPWDAYLGEGLKHCFVNWFHARSTGLRCLLDIMQPFPPG